MGSLQLLFALLHAIVYLSAPVNCDEGKDRDSLLQGLNSYRTSRSLPAFGKNDNAECLAEKVAEELEEHPRGPGGVAMPASALQLDDYPDMLRKCNIDPNATADGVILPVSVPRRVSTMVLTNYTNTQYARYMNNSMYTGIGIGMEDDWTVVVLSTGVPGGSFASGASPLVYAVGSVLALLTMILPLVVAVVVVMH